MIRYVDGVGVMGGLNWASGPAAGAGEGLFGLLLGDAAGASRLGPGAGEAGRASERMARERERKGSGIEAGGSVLPPLETNDRRTGRGERPDPNPQSGSRQETQADRTTSRDRGIEPREGRDGATRTEGRAERPAQDSPREGEASGGSDGESGDGEAALRSKVEAGAMADASLAARGLAVSAGVSTIRLIAQPGGELAMSMSQPAGRGAVDSASRQGTPGQTRSAEAEAVLRAASRGINSALAQRGGTITIRLIPETLGALRVQVEVDAGRVSVRIEATNAQSAELLNASTASLRQSLESRGMQVDRILITTPSAEPSRAVNSQDSPAHDPEAEGGPWARERRDDGAEDPDSGGAPERRDENPEADERSPMGRFGERLRLILDGLG